MSGIRKDHPLLFIPGPTEVHERVAEAATEPMIGHRGPQISELLEDVLPRVGRLLNTKSSVYPLGCSATGAMEAAVRNAGDRPVLNLVCGAFSDRWAGIREACGIEGERLEVDWGLAVDPDDVSRRLGAGDFGAVTLVHNETSTGVMNPLPPIAAAVRESSDALLLVDTVSSMAAVELSLDEWGVDVCLAGSQKAWALPPGLTLCAVSPRALLRSEDARAKGYYFDWLVHQKSLDKWQTPTTPPISLLHQLRVALDLIDEEGVRERYDRHRRMRDQVHAWAQGRFGSFAAPGFESHTLTALDGEGVDLAELLRRCRDRGFVVGNGYGKTKGRVFRVGHMGNIDEALLGECLAVIDEELVAMGVNR